MMKLALLILLLAVISFANAIAQNSLPRAYKIKIDTATNVLLDEAYWQMLEDPAGELTIDQISQAPIDDKFHPNTTKEKGIDFSIQAYWVRYRFSNSMRHEARITITKNVTYVDLYTRNSDKNWNHKRTGTGVPWSKRNDLKRIKALTYSIPPGEELLIYERNNFAYDKNMSGLPAIQFGFTERILQERYLDDNSSVLPSILFGFFIFAALFNLYFFLIIHEKVYLLLSLTILSRAIASFLLDTDFFFREYPIVDWYLSLIFSLFYFFFWIHFVRYFLEIFKYFPRWDKLLIGLSFYLIIIWTLYAVHIIRNDEPWFGTIMFITYIPFLLFIRSGNKSVNWRIVAVLPVIAIFPIPLVHYLFRLIQTYSGNPTPSFITWLFNNFNALEQVCFVGLLIFFFWSLLQRYQLLQKQIAQETLTKERLAKEKEIERNQLIAQQKVQLEKEVEERTAELQHSIKELKATQAQLVQKEKMASLGELTAGIAHEIQNPLNFVNNFSDVSEELCSEIEQEAKAGNTGEVLSITADLKQNLEKINHHGKRADSIVKSMLQHSRVTSGEKQLTDINALTEEYLRLSYHGLRAKDKDFNADFKLEADPALGKVEVVPQEIGRVLLNLFNNAFYATQQKKVQLNGQYQPQVTVTTKSIENKVEIRVRDNGIGIPENIRQKIFQPFFTTKPTGEGTGLGLSLSYDIITKGHGGELRVESIDGTGSEFLILLPHPKPN